jgi:pilus assembly protein FimV
MLSPIGDLGVNTDYFSNASAASQKPVESMDEPTLEAPTEQPAAKLASNEMDFDLDGFNSIEVPNTIARPAPSEPNVDLGSIDFDFLQEANVVPDIPAPAVEPANTAVPDIQFKDAAAPAKEQAAADSIADDATALNMDFPSVPDLPAFESNESVRAASASTQDPVDFDLSGINLELNPAQAESKPDLALDTSDAFGSGGTDSFPNDAEMATKLDLAIAYQEIGDKEGARELLDEVLKGGNAAQSEKARSLLHELA